jgi:hypothetical protein
MAKTFKIINRLPYASIFMPELLFVYAKASVHFFSPITLLYRKNLLFILNITGWCKEYKIVVSDFRVQQQIESLFTCSALLGGWRNNNGNFNNIGNNGNWWSSSENDTNNAWNLNMNSNNQNTNMNNNNNNEWGFSVRCLQD